LQFEIKPLINPELQEIDLIGDLAQDAFIRFGDYKEFISQLVLEKNVITGVCIDTHEKDKIIGFILIGFIKNDPFYESEILAIALEKPYRGKKIGGTLLEWCIKVLSDSNLSISVDKVKLTVARDNYQAVKLFKNFGFEFEDIDIGDYPTGVKASYMVKEL
jgi:ribosomal protein S18 acetylase RimI-like enzyme